METSDQEKFANSLGVLCEIFDKQISPIVIRAYFQALRPYPVEEVEGAISQAIVSCKFFPRPVELIELITGGREAIEDKAEILAREVVEQTRTVGAYGTPEINDPVMSLVVSRHGWGNLCRANEKDQGFIIRDLVRSYLAHERQRAYLQIEHNSINEIEHEPRATDLISA